MIPMCACATSRPSLSITERSAFGIVTDLTETGYLVKHKDGRRNRTASKPICPCPKK